MATELFFTTTPIERVVKGKMHRVPISIKLALPADHDLNKLQANIEKKIQAEVPEENIKVMGLKANGDPVNHVTQIQAAGRGTDFLVEVKQLTATEANDFNEVKALSREKSAIQASLADKIAEREALDGQINTLTENLAQVSEKIREKAPSVAWLIKQQPKSAVTSQQKNTLFSPKLSVASAQRNTVPASPATSCPV